MRWALATLLAMLALASAPAVAGATGTIAGTITAPAGKAPVGTAGALVGDTIYAASIQADGSYELPNLPAGQHRVGFLAPPGQGDAPPGQALLTFYHGVAGSRTAFLADAAPVTVVDGQTTIIDGAFPLEAVLRGHAGRFPDGSLARSEVHVYNSDGRLYPQDAAASQGGDLWSIRGLLPGDVRVSFSSSLPRQPDQLLPWNPGCAPDCGVPPAPFFVETELWRNKYSLGTADPISLAEGELAEPLEAPVLGRAGQIFGTALKPDGTPLRDVRVYLRKPDGRRAGPFVTDYQGKYVAYGLRPGDWSVAFVPATSTYLTEYYDASPTLAGSTPVTVGYGQRVQISASLERAGRIAGLVTDESRGAIQGVKVSVYNGFDQVVGTATTGANGQYNVGRLRVGAYRVGFEPPAGSGFAAEFYDNIAHLADASSVWVPAGGTAPAIDAELVPE